MPKEKPKKAVHKQVGERKEKQQELPHVPTLEERVEALEKQVAKLSGKPKPKP